MSIYSIISNIYPFSSLPDLSQDYADIDKFSEIFSSNPSWKTAKKSGLYHSGFRSVHMMNTAKVLCDFFSQLIFSEQVSIVASNETCQKYIDDVLNKSGFWKAMPQWLSFSFALGGGALKTYAYDNKICIDFVHANRFIPLAWNNNSITSGAFLSVSFHDGFFYTLIERHFYNDDGIYSIEHKLFKSKQHNSIGSEIPLEERFPLLSPMITINTPTPLFTYFKPAVSNNLHPYSPLGLSVFANACDTIKALDIAFDSFTREFILGKKRIIVPSSCVQTVVDITTGEQRQYFDADDEAYVALKCDEERDLKITDNTITLRIEDHVKAINALLNILCFQCGLSAGALSFDEIKGVRTATEILYRDNKTASAAKHNKNILTEAIEAVSHSVLYLGACIGHISHDDAANCDVTISWHDGIVCDDNTLIENNIKLVSAGLKSRLSAVMEVLKCDENTAKNELSKILNEQTN